MGPKNILNSLSKSYAWYFLNFHSIKSFIRFEENLIFLKKMRIHTFLATCCNCIWIFHVFRVIRNLILFAKFWNNFSLGPEALTIEMAIKTDGMKNVFMERPWMTSDNFWWFWTPYPTYHIWQLLTYNVRYLGVILDPLTYHKIGRHWWTFPYDFLQGIHIFWQ